MPAPQVTGAEMSAYLPAAVRSRAVAEVPSPSRWLGSLVEWLADDDTVARQELVMLRMDKRRAFVVAAERGARQRRAASGWSAEAMAARPWRLTWVRYELAERQTGPALPGREQRRLGS